MAYEAAQAFMRDRRIDGWLVHDFRGSNPVLAQLLPGRAYSLTRRAELFIPASGEPVLITQALDAPQFAQAPVRVAVYKTWGEHRAALQRVLDGRTRIAMEYSPGGALPVVAIVDAGTVELVRSLGAEVVSSADLLQATLAVWSAQVHADHLKACAACATIMDAAWGLVRAKVTAGAPLNELQVQRFITDRFAAAGLETYSPPIVGVNAHSGDPHFEVSETDPWPIRRDDWLLIDLWARVPGMHNIYADITWVGWCGKQVPAAHRRVWEATRGARDAALKRARDGFARGEPVQGWQVDDAARKVIIDAGFADNILHRTGHSLSFGRTTHGIGVNLDNMETHDTRELLPGLGFTIEPGIYTGEFGARSEIDVYVDPGKGPVVTSCIQNDVVIAG